MHMFQTFYLSVQLRLASLEMQSTFSGETSRPGQANALPVYYMAELFAACTGSGVKKHIRLHCLCTLATDSTTLAVTQIINTRRHLRFSVWKIN